MALFGVAAFWASTSAAMAQGTSYIVFFDYQKGTPPSTAGQVIRMAKSAMKPGALVTVTGHCDTAESNPERLASTRARAIAKALRSAGLPSGVRIRVASAGSSSPLVPTGAGMKEPQNRRAQILIRQP